MVNYKEVPRKNIFLCLIKLKTKDKSVRQIQTNHPVSNISAANDNFHKPFLISLSFYINKIKLILNTSSSGFPFFKIKIKNLGLILWSEVLYLKSLPLPTKKKKKKKT